MTDEPWRRARVAPDQSHHLVEGVPLYAARFDEVLKFHPPGLAPVRAGGLAWHINDRGDAVYARRFVRTFGFYEGLSAVQGIDGWHHIHPDGRDLTGERYAWCGNFQEGRCTVRDTENWYQHIDASGRPAYQRRYRYAGDFREGIAVVQRQDGRSSHVDEVGRLIHGVHYLDLDVFHKGFARARDDRGWMHVDRSGRPIYAHRFASVEPFYNGQARVETDDGALMIIDERGDRVLELRSAEGDAASEARPAIQKLDGKKEGPLRILLIGLPGAGKSTLAAALCGRFAVRLFAIDDFRQTHADGTVAGDCFARAHFLRSCGTQARALFEFSAVGVHRYDVATALREFPGPLLTVWVDAEDAVREQRLLARGGRLPWPRYRLDATRRELEAKGHAVLREDYEQGFWTREPDWHACRLDTGDTVEAACAELMHLVDKFLLQSTTAS